MKKKLICTMLAGVMAASVLAGCGGDGKTAAGTVKDEDGITIPEKITVMVDGTLVTVTVHTLLIRYSKNDEI